MTTDTPQRNPAMTDTPEQIAASTPAKPEPAKAWGIINYGGGLMSIAFMHKTHAEIDRLNRWPGEPGKSRVIPVTITPDGE